jgi:hypothetical protein
MPVQPLPPDRYRHLRRPLPPQRPRRDARAHGRPRTWARLGDTIRADAGVGCNNRTVILELRPGWACQARRRHLGMTHNRTGTDDSLSRGCLVRRDVCSGAEPPGAARGRHEHDRRQHLPIVVPTPATTLGPRRLRRHDPFEQLPRLIRNQTLHHRHGRILLITPNETTS